MGQYSIYNTREGVGKVMVIFLAHAIDLIYLAHLVSALTRKQSTCMQWHMWRALAINRMGAALVHAIKILLKIYAFSGVSYHCACSLAWFVFDASTGWFAAHPRLIQALHGQLRLSSISRAASGIAALLADC